MLEPSDREQVDRAVALVRQVLDGDVVGAYLFGSAVQGGLRPESDVDVLVVSRRRTSLDEKERLARGLMAVSGAQASEGPLRRIEVTVVVQRDVRPWRYPPWLDFQFGDWLRAEFERGNFEPSRPRHRPDVALLITMVLAAGSPLVGPPAGSVLDPVPHEDVLRAMLSDMDRLRRDTDQDTRNVILTLARMWSTFATGAIRSKDAAAEWVVGRLPAAHRPVVAHAREAYLGREAERWNELRDVIAPCVDHMIAEVHRIAAARCIQP